MTSDFDFTRRVNALSKAATEWLDRESPESVFAMERSLSAPNWFTRPALSTAVDRVMARVTVSELTAWITPSLPERGARIAVLNAGNVPFVGIQDFLAVLASGLEYLGITSRSSPYLLPAFAETVRRYDATIACRFLSLEKAMAEADAAIATGSTSTVQLVSGRFTEAGIHGKRQLLRGTRQGAALLSGNESDEDLFRLSSDVLLHEGRGCRSVAVVLAPIELDKGRFVEQAVQFRREFPPHERTLAALQRATRFLGAVNEPFVEGDGFVVVEGDIALREPCVLRWIRYRSEEEALAWFVRHRKQLQLVVGSKPASETQLEGIDLCRFGEGQDPPLRWCPNGKDTVAFLKEISVARL